MLADWEMSSYLSLGRHFQFIRWHWRRLVRWATASGQYDGQLFILLQMVYEDEDEELIFEQVSLLVGKNL
jgi:hypothetical protein